MIDITGQKFGQLTVIEKLKDKNNRTVWKTICDCGTEKIFPSYKLIKKERTSCGCHPHGNLNNIIGERFYNLVIIERIPKKVGNRYRSFWRCKCDCGKEIIIKKIYGGVKSCGCKRSINLIGKRFNNLLVIEKLKAERTGRCILWRCQCNCGKETTAQTNHLTHNIKKSCGCLVGKNLNSLANIKPKYGINHPDWKGCGDISGSFWGTIKRNAKIRNHKLDVTISQAWELFLTQNKKCALSGVELNFAKRKEPLERLTTASLDRIDSSKGYIAGNIQWVHVDINYMKQAFSQELFLNWCKIISHYQSLKTVSLKEDQEIL